jgi:hypothetical protein
MRLWLCLVAGLAVSGALPAVSAYALGPAAEKPLLGFEMKLAGTDSGRAT